MSTTSLPLVVKQVKFQYDRYDARQVYAAIKQFYPLLSAKDYTPELIAAFIPEDADVTHWLKTLRNVEHNQANPRPRRKSRYVAKGNQKHNPAEAVTRRVLTDALLGIA